MTCFHPLHGFKSQELTKNGKRQLTFSPQHGYVDLPQTVPCGQCIGCRIERSRHWALRCTHEASLHKTSVFVTLTYDDKYLPPGGTLVKSDLQKFMKRLRKSFPGKIRFFACGEYGDKDRRPHYHAILFGADFPDKRFHSWSNKGKQTANYSSDTLDKIWGKGITQFAYFTYQNAAYTARYIMKKIGGDLAEKHYQQVDTRTGEIHQLTPEFASMSLKPGIGFDWYQRYKKDAFPSDYLVQGGRRHTVPDYYTRLLAKEEEARHKQIKNSRKSKLARHKANNTPERLAVREEVKLSKLKLLQRNI